ncbi:hypothetical protein F5884DRAFT_796976 [Xylogone sp. PMI_703]|nr:hypothetical protein F5884DRAFT_796976 [Xylogone sp. PMI_703]
MDSSPSKANLQPTLPKISGVKRPAPTLLPAFEPSSSPSLPRPLKRQARSSSSERDVPYAKYPTPIPTSTTGILSSSPPRLLSRQGGRPRAESIVSERAPLSAVRTVTLPQNGEELLMGRSSNSSHYQLSANRLISRVHVKARYIEAGSPFEPNKVEIICTGWNGIKLHCQGRTWELAKGDSFTSETENAEIMLDVQDARVLIAWPSKNRKGSLAEALWDEEGSPSGRNSAMNSRGHLIESSPLRRSQRLQSPDSPTPAGGPSIASASFTSLFTNSAAHTIVQVYEDEGSDNEKEASKENDQSRSQGIDFGRSQSSDLSDPEDEDPDEENDPIVLSFGPFGANISSRMASFTAGSPEPPRGRVRSVKASPEKSRSSSEATNAAPPSPIVNHVINQLAFSRLSSTPISMIMSHLPAELRNPHSTGVENRGFQKDDLRKLLNATKCIGEIHREGKDAAGKALESEYYYIADEDEDEQRKAVVDGLRKPSLRNCRKQHKQYYWKRPKTP